jgi:bacterioferritin
MVKVLNEAFAEEWLAYYQYWIGAKVARGIMRPDVEKEFTEHAHEELGHAGKLADRIIQLGGKPLLNPKEWEKHARCKYDEPKNEDVAALLKQNIAGERCAIQRYQEICEMCYGGKDIATFHLARSILDDELEHEQDLEDLRDDIDLLIKEYGCHCNDKGRKKK